MATFFSPSKLSFFDEGIHGPRYLRLVDELAQEDALEKAASDEEREVLLGNPPIIIVPNENTLIPADAIEITAEEHADIIEQLGQGRALTVKNGKPVAVVATVSVEEQLDAMRRQRDQELAKTDWTQLPDALSAAKRKLWADHRKALRNLPAMLEKAVAAGEPVDSVPFPPAPDQGGATA